MLAVNAIGAPIEGPYVLHQVPPLLQHATQSRERHSSALSKHLRKKPLVPDEALERNSETSPSYWTCCPAAARGYCVASGFQRPSPVLVVRNDSGRPLAPTAEKALRARSRRGTPVSRLPDPEAAADQGRLRVWLGRLLGGLELRNEL